MAVPFARQFRWHPVEAGSLERRDFIRTAALLADYSSSFLWQGVVYVGRTRR